MKITLDINEGLAADIVNRTGQRLDLQDGYHLSVESTGQVIVNIRAVDKPMQSSSESGASGSLSFA